jgi:hypothetical protein
MNDLTFVRQERTREKIQNVAFALFIDAYIERLTFSVYKCVGAKPIKGPDLEVFIL